MSDSWLSEMMTSAEIAELLRMKRSTVEDYARRGLLPSIKLGRHRRFIRSAAKPPWSSCGEPPHASARADRSGQVAARTRCAQGQVREATATTNAQKASHFSGHIRDMEPLREVRRGSETGSFAAVSLRAREDSNL